VTGYFFARDRQRESKTAPLTASAIVNALQHRSHRLTRLGSSACLRTLAARLLVPLLGEPIVDRSSDLLADSSTGARLDFAKRGHLLRLQHHWKPLLGRHGTCMC